MYQEVDLIDIALGSARKQCDDAKERANRLSVTVDRLRDALSRFMSKVMTTPFRPFQRETVEKLCMDRRKAVAVSM